MWENCESLKEIGETVQCTVQESKEGWCRSLEKNPLLAHMFPQADDEIEVKCVVPCNGKSGLPGDAASNAQYSYFPGVFEKLSDVDKANLIKKGFVASPWKKPYESISSKRDTRAMCHNQNNKKTFNTNLKKRSGVIQRISQVAQRITNFFYDLRVFSQLYYTFLAVPIESFLCEESNRYGTPRDCNSPYVYLSHFS